MSALDASNTLRCLLAVSSSSCAAEEDTTFLSHIYDICLAVDRDALFARLDAKDVVLSKWVSRTNELLSAKQSAARVGGLELLRLLVKQRSETLTKHAASWVHTTQQCCRNQELAAVAEVGVIAVVDVLIAASQIPELQRETVTSSVPKTFTTLLQLATDISRPKLLNRILISLKTLVHHFPTQARYTSDKMTTLCLTTLEGRFRHDSHPVIGASQLLSALCTCSGRNNASEIWQSNVDRILGCINNTLDSLFHVIDEDVMEKTLLNAFETTLTYEDPVSQYPLLVNRLLVLYQHLRAHISSTITVPVSLPLQVIISIICRVFNINDSATILSGKDKNEFQMLLMSLCDIYKGTLMVLDDLIDSVGPRLIVYTSSLSAIFIRLLAMKNRQPNDIIVETTLSILPKLLTVMGFDFFHRILDAFVTTALQIMQFSATLNSLSPLAIEIVTQNSGETDKAAGWSNGKRQLSHQAMAIKLTNGSYDSSMATTLGTNALHPPPLVLLNTLSVLFTQFGGYIPLSFRAQLDECLLRHVYWFQVHTTTRTTPIYEASIRMTLLDVLVASVLVPSSCISAQTTHKSTQPYSIVDHVMWALGVSAARDQEVITRATARRLLAIMDILRRPRLPPVEARPLRIVTCIDTIENSTRAITSDLNMELEETVSNDNDELKQDHINSVNVTEGFQPVELNQEPVKSSFVTPFVYESLATKRKQLPVPLPCDSSIIPAAFTPDMRTVSFVDTFNDLTTTIIKRQRLDTSEQSQLISDSIISDLSSSLHNVDTPPTCTVMTSTTSTIITTNSATNVNKNLEIVSSFLENNVTNLLSTDIHHVSSRENDNEDNLEMDDMEFADDGPDSNSDNDRVNVESR